MEKAGRPLTLAALATQLRIKTEPHRKSLENRLRAMVRDGQLLRNRAREYCLTGHLDVVTGVVQFSGGPWSIPKNMEWNPVKPRPPSGEKVGPLSPQKVASACAGELPSMQSAAIGFP